MQKRKQWVLLTLLLLATLAAGAIFWCDRAIDRAARGRLYSRPDQVPYNKTGLLLGTAKYLANGHVNPYYRYRIEAAVQLAKAEKIKHLVISGDNSRHDYNEPELMRADLVAAGVDSAHIFLDYAGFRTFDSIVRLREIFGQRSATIISQPFHNERAIYLATREGIAAVGFNARDVGARSGIRIKAREKLARVKVFVDYLTGTEPRFLGEKIVLP
ncbi:ElyC/SanA/YdcF family protein [Paraflavisolibacter sp. H34]|uniref:SanA/YdcF family protein n=1 Tax=Huijunlia imazamoxiresistens TaxID=3127457 RepID=UPI003016A39F